MKALPPDTFVDIYEGCVWKECNSISGHPFLSQPNNLCLMLNIDWFNPYDETPYSAGVVYFVIQGVSAINLRTLFWQGVRRSRKSTLTPFCHQLLWISNAYMQV